MPRSDCWRPREAGPLDELERARADLLHAEIAFAAESRQRRAAAAAARRPSGSSRWTRGSRARPISTRWRAALFAGHLANAGSLLEVSGALATAPPTRAPAAPARPAAGRLRAACSPRGAPPPSRCCSGRCARSPVPISPWRRSCAAGAGWQQRRPRSCGTTTPGSRSPPARSSSPASRVRSRSCRRRQRARSGCRHWAATSRAPGSWWPRPMRSQRPRGPASPPTRRSFSPPSAVRKPRPPR